MKCDEGCRSGVSVAVKGDLIGGLDHPCALRLTAANRPEGLDVGFLALERIPRRLTGRRQVEGKQYAGNVR